MRRHSTTRPLLVATAAAAALHVAGRGTLAAPPLDIDDIARWFAERDPITAVFALLRLLAFAGTCYVAIVLAGTSAAAALHAPRLRHAVDALTIPFIRRLVASAAGATVLLPATPGLAGAAEPPAAVAVMVRLPDEQSAAGDPSLPTEMTTKTVVAPTDEQWVVEAGDSFWSIAVELAGDHLGRDASDNETTGYWRQLIDANRDRLIDPADPNLLRPGQELVIPPF